MGSTLAPSKMATLPQSPSLFSLHFGMVSFLDFIIFARILCFYFFHNLILSFMMVTICYFDVITFGLSFLLKYLLRVSFYVTIFCYRFYSCLLKKENSIDSLYIYIHLIVCTRRKLPQCPLKRLYHEIEMVGQSTMIKRCPAGFENTSCFQTYILKFKLFSRIAKSLPCCMLMRQPSCQCI